jgi:hypothetical protein
MLAKTAATAPAARIAFEGIRIMPTPLAHAPTGASAKRC